VELVAQRGWFGLFSDNSKADGDKVSHLVIYRWHAPSTWTSF